MLFIVVHIASIGPLLHGWVSHEFLLHGGLQDMFQLCSSYVHQTVVVHY